MSTDAPGGPRTIFLVPDIHDLQTGGNVYNRQMIEGLPPASEVRVCAWTPNETSAAALGLSEGDVIVVDSLLAERRGALRALRTEYPAATLVVLVHYLDCVDPYTEDPDVAAEGRAMLSVADAAIATSQYVRRALIDEGFAAEQVMVVRPGLHARYRGALPLRLGRRPPRLLTVANLLPTKGLRPFVDVLARLRDLPWTWHLVGDLSLDPEYAANVYRRLRATGLTHRTTWTGVVAPDALRTWYDRADLFVLPSRFETCSLSTREAMACGLPVVGYRVGGMPENVGDSAAGALVRPHNPRALRDALRALLKDPLARRERGRAAWRQSRAFPTWSAAAEQFRDALTALHDRTSESA